MIAIAHGFTKRQATRIMIVVNVELDHYDMYTGIEKNTDGMYDITFHYYGKLNQYSTIMSEVSGFIEGLRIGFKYPSRWK